MQNLIRSGAIIRSVYDLSSKTRKEDRKSESCTAFQQADINPYDSVAPKHCYEESEFFPIFA